MSLSLAIAQIKLPPNYGEIYGRGEKKKHAGRPMSALRRARGDAFLAISEEVGERKTVDDLMPFIRAGNPEKGRAPDATLNRDDARRILDELVEAGLMTKTHKTIDRHRRSFYLTVKASEK